MIEVPDTDAPISDESLAEFYIDQAAKLSGTRFQKLYKFGSGYGCGGLIVIETCKKLAGKSFYGLHFLRPLI